MSDDFRTFRNARGYLQAAPKRIPCPYCLIESGDLESLRWHIASLHATLTETVEVLREISQSLAAIAGRKP